MDVAIDTNAKTRRFVLVALALLTLTALAGALPGVGPVDELHVLLLIATALAIAWHADASSRPPKFQQPAAKVARVSAVALSARDERVDAAASAPAGLVQAEISSGAGTTAPGADAEAIAASLPDAAGLEPVEGTGMPAEFTTEVDEAIRRVLSETDAVVAAAGPPSGAAAVPSGTSKSWSPVVSLWPAGPALWHDASASGRQRYATLTPFTVPPDHAFRLLTDVSNWMRPELAQAGGSGQSSALEEARQVASFGNNTNLLYLRTRRVGFSSAREILVVLHRRRLPDGRLLAASVSVTDEVRCPAQRSLTRVDVNFSGAIFAPWPSEPDHCYVVFVVDADPKMWVPTRLVHMLANQLTSPVHRAISDLIHKAPRYDRARALTRHLARHGHGHGQHHHHHPHHHHSHAQHMSDQEHDNGSAAASALGGASASSADAGAVLWPPPVVGTRGAVSSTRGGERALLAGGPLALIYQLHKALQWASPFMLAVVYIILSVRLWRAYLQRRRTSAMVAVAALAAR